MFLCKSFNKTGKCSKGVKCLLAHQRLNARNILKSDISKYKKINNTRPVITAKQPEIEKSVHRAILNNLLAKRIETTSESNRQIVSQPNTGVGNCSDFIPLTVNLDSSKNLLIDQIITKNQNIDGKHGKVLSNRSVRKKYFVIDNDEEKLSDYLNYDTRLSSENICRPQLKIIPNFLMKK